MIPVPLRSILWLFIAVNLFTVIFYSGFRTIHADPDVFLIGNLYLCIITVVSFWLMTKGLKSKSTLNFTSSVYGSFLLKLVLTALLVVVYSLRKGNAINSNSILGCMLLYLIYMFLEVKGLMSVLRKD